MEEEDGMKKIIAALLGALLAAFVIDNKETKNKQRLQSTSDKYMDLFKLMNQWVKVKQEEKNLSEYFKAKGYKTIGIYGMSYAGETLVAELAGTGVTVLYGIDQRMSGTVAGIDMVSLNDIREGADVIVVTAIAYFDEIEKTLQKKVKCPIVSLEEVIFEVQHMM